MAKLESLVKELSTLTILEAAELSKMLEEEWGVSAAAAPMMMAMPGAAPAAEAEKTDFDVVLTSVGDNKINVIKVVRELTALGLKEAKDVVDALGVLKAGLPKADAEAWKAKLEAAGAKIDLK